MFGRDGFCFLLNLFYVLRFTLKGKSIYYYYYIIDSFRLSLLKTKNTRVITLCRMTDMIPQAYQVDIVLEQAIPVGTVSLPLGGTNSLRTLWT